MNTRIDVTTNVNSFVIDIAVLDFYGTARSHIGRAAKWTVMDADDYVLTDRAGTIHEAAIEFAEYHLGACDFDVYVDGRLVVDTLARYLTK